MLRPPPIYTASPSPSSCLRQGEVICNLFELQRPSQPESSEEGAVVFFVHPYAVVISQDCDLEQDWSSRMASGKGAAIASVLFCALQPASISHPEIKKYVNWQSLQQNNLVRYQFLQKVDPSCDAQQIGLDEMVADFKQYLSPYLEHLCVRFSQFLSRVALPRNHSSD
jgi:hypothetical protein